MKRNLTAPLLALLGGLLLATPSLAQNVAYSGKLHIGLGDQDNLVPTGLRSNNAIPICAGNPLVNPASTKPAGTTLGTLLVNGRATNTGSGPGSALTFSAVSGATGGAQERENATCNVSIPGFANPRLRSRTQVGAAHWPGQKGKFLPGLIYTKITAGGTQMVGFADGDVPLTPTATYMVSAAGGNVFTPLVSGPYSIMLTQTRVINNTTTMFGTFTNTVTDTMASPTMFTTMTVDPTGMTTSMLTDVFTEVGVGGVATVPFFGVGGGVQVIQPGAAKFGGGVPFSGGGGVQLGVNFTVVGPTGMTLAPGDYGQVLYANGFLPTDPQVFGTDAKGISILNPAAGYIAPATDPTLALVIGRQDLSYAARTPGGTKKSLQGDIRTLGGGDTATPLGAFTIPTTTMGAGPGTGMSAGPGIGVDCVNLTIPGFGGANYPGALIGMPSVQAPCPSVISPVAFSGQFGGWTTGMVQHLDQGGDFVTIRSATGFDEAVTAGTMISNETRKLQLVAPWSASIKPVGPFGLGALLPDLNFGGVAIVDLRIIPVPEPGTLAMLGFGIAGLGGLTAIRRRNS